LQPKPSTFDALFLCARTPEGVELVFKMMKGEGVPVRSRTFERGILSLQNNAGLAETELVQKLLLEAEEASCVSPGVYTAALAVYLTGGAPDAGMALVNRCVCMRVCVWGGGGWVYIHTYIHTYIHRHGSHQQADSRQKPLPVSAILQKCLFIFFLFSFYFLFIFFFINRLTADKSPYLSAHFYSLALKLCSKYEEEESLKRLAEEECNSEKSAL
jgi:hypothetical protein